VAWIIIRGGVCDEAVGTSSEVELHWGRAERFAEGVRSEAIGVVTCGDEESIATST